MGVSFEAPIWLLLLVPALAITVALHLGARRRMGAGRRRVALGVRAVLLAALVFAIAGFQLVLPVDRLATVFVVDLSDSVGNAGREEALAFLRETLAEKPDGDVAGIVAFGKEALVERLPSELEDIDRIASAPVKSATDIGAALRLATALFPDDAQKRIVLLSDGNDTTGAGQAEAALAASRGVRIETRSIGLGEADEVLVERLTTPSTARLGESIEAVADIRSSVAQSATVRLFADGVLVATEPVQLTAGSTRVTFDVTPSEAGFHTFRAVVEAAQDTFSENDRADSNTIVKGEPRTLVLAGNDAVATELVAALQSQDQLVDRIVPEALPTDFAGLATYDSIVLVDVPRIRLSDRQLAALQVYVRDLGKGLVMVGGEDSFGAGGYQRTPLEESLPVDMGVRDRQKQPDIALVVVIDKSGSMAACHCNTFDRGSGAGIAGVEKVDIGKEAILRAAAAMTERDELGVVAFNEAAHWVVQTQPIGSIGDLQGQIAGIRADGQTNIYAGLDQAVQSLEGVAATRRHIILLTDGWSSSGQYDEILAKMRADGITLSTVGAGGGANPFLEQLAKDGGGRFYAAANPASIPDIFLKETQQVSGQQIVEEPFFPILTSSSPILRGLDDGLPQLRGYNGTTAKPAAQTVLVTARDDPLLAQWQYGLGRSVAWTSDATGRWAKDWLGWDGFNRFFSQLVSWTFPGEETDGIEARFDERRRARVPARRERGGRRLATRLLRDHGLGRRPEPRAGDRGPDPDGPGRVRGTARRRRARGLCRPRDADQTRLDRRSVGPIGLVAPTAAEYRLLGTDAPFLASLRSVTGGRQIETALDPWVHDLTATDRSTDLWPLLLVLALLLWPLDIALRRVSIGRREFAAARGWVTGFGGRRRARRPANGDEREPARGPGRAAGLRVASRLAREAPPSTTGAVVGPAAPTGAAPSAATAPGAAAGAVPSTVPDPRLAHVESDEHADRTWLVTAPSCERPRRHHGPPQGREATGPRPLRPEAGVPAAPRGRW